MQKISVYYFNSDNIENFGDVLNPLIVSHFTHKEVVWGDYKRADLLAIGSILQGLVKKAPSILDKIKRHFRTPIHIWGSGVISPIAKNTMMRRPVIVHALRGPYTKAEISKHTKQDLSNIPMGDPGLLASLLLDVQPEKKFKVGIIPHYVDQSDPKVEELKALHPSSTVISILGNPIEILKKIAECEIILSSAMHGLIAADSLSIPNQWIRFSDNLTGGDFKFNDYYAVFGVTPTSWDVRTKQVTQDDILSIADRYPITPDQIKKIQNGLLAALPFKN